MSRLGRDSTSFHWLDPCVLLHKGERDRVLAVAPDGVDLAEVNRRRDRRACLRDVPAAASTSPSAAEEQQRTVEFTALQHIGQTMW